MSERIVTVYLIEDLPDGTRRVGNSEECDVEQAVVMIEQGFAKAEGYAIGVVPPSWVNGKVGEAVVDGEYFDS